MNPSGPSSGFRGAAAPVFVVRRGRAEGMTMTFGQ